MLDKIKRAMGMKEKPIAKEKPKRQKKTDKEIATANGEPYVAVLSMELEKNNMDRGAFELDWNDKFIANLVRAGYQQKPGEPEHDIVDRWFQNVCRNVVLETYEQEQADPEIRYVKARDLGDGYTEVK